jgi:hypothetical protein
MTGGNLLIKYDFLIVGAGLYGTVFAREAVVCYRTFSFLSVLIG